MRWSCGVRPEPGVADEDDDVGLVDRKLGLAGHGLDDAFGLDGLEAAVSTTM